MVLKEVGRKEGRGRKKEKKIPKSILRDLTSSHSIKATNLGPHPTNGFMSKDYDEAQASSFFFFFLAAVGGDGVIYEHPIIFF